MEVGTVILKTIAITTLLALVGTTRVLAGQGHLVNGWQLVQVAEEQAPYCQLALDQDFQIVTVLEPNHEYLLYCDSIEQTQE